MIFQPSPASGDSDSSQPTATPVRPEIDTATEGFAASPVTADETPSSGKNRRVSGTTSGFGSNLASSASAGHQEPAQPITDLDELHRVLLSLEFVSEEQWQHAFEHAGDQPSVVSVLSQFMTMPAQWDAKATVLTDYQCEEIQAGRASDLRFNQYLVLSLLGEGGMGKVFKARHIYLDAIHALKTIRRDRFGQGGTANPEVIHTMVKRFLGEFRGMAKLLVAKDPEHFAQVHDAGDADGIPYYAMEFIDGQSLDDMLRENTKTNEPPPLDETLSLFAEIADAVGTAHDLNIVHRDLTPRNIMITRHGKPKIIDFGIAKELKRDEETGVATAGLTELTTSGQQVGSRPYMSPEQHAGDIERISFSTDVYVLAATLFQYLTLQLPFPGTTAMEVMLKHLAPERPALSSFRQDVPVELDEVVQKALAIEPLDRYQTMGEFKEALLSARDAVGNPTRARRRRKTTSKNGPMAATLLFGILAAGGAIYFLQKPGDQNARSGGATTIAAGGGNQASPSEPSLFAKWAAPIESLRSQGKHSEAINLCQKGLAESGLTELERKKLIDDLLDSTAQEYVPPTSQQDAERIIEIVKPYRDDASTVKYAVDGLLSRAIKETSLANRNIIKTLVLDAKVGEAARSAAIERYKSWWNDAALSFADRLDSLSRLRELAPDEAMILAQSAVTHGKEAAQQSARQNRDQAKASLEQVRQLVNHLTLPDGESQLVQIGRWERLLGLPSLDAASAESAKAFFENLPKNRADLEQLDAAHGELGMSSPTPTDLAAQAVDVLAGEILSSNGPDQKTRIEQLNETAVSLGIADRSSQLSRHFGSQAFREIAQIVANPGFSMDELDQRVREFDDRLNNDQRGLIDAIKSVRLRAYVAAAAKFRELKLNTSDAPWAQYRAESMIEELAVELSKEKPDRELVGKQLAELESKYRVNSANHARFAALKAHADTDAGQFALAAGSIAEGIDALAKADAGSSLWSIDTARKELRDAARSVMDKAIVSATSMIDANQDPSDLLTQAERIANLRLIDGNPLGLDEDAKSAFRNRSSRLSFLRGRYFFQQRQFADATEQFRKIDSSLLGSDAFKDAKSYWLISQAFSEANIPGKLITNDESPVVPPSIQGKPEEHLLAALWEMGRDLGTATQTKTLASAATYSTLLNKYLDQRQQAPPAEQSSPEAVAHVLDVYLSTITDLPRKTQGWERAINLSQLVDPKIPDEEKSLRQVEIFTRDLVAIAGHGNGIGKPEVVTNLHRIGLLMSTKPVGIYSSVVRETPIGEKTPYKYYVFFNDAYNSEFSRYMTWSAARIDAVGASQFATDATLGLFISVWNRARMRLAYFQEDWPLCLRSARNLLDLDSPLRDEQPETEVANLCDAFSKLTQGKPSEEVNTIIQKATDPASRQLPGKEYTPAQLSTLKRWKSLFQLIAHLHGSELAEESRKEAIAQIENLLSTWNGTDSATIKWPIWERPIVLGYYQKYPAEAKPAIETLARLPVPRLSPVLEKSLSDAATAWKVPPKSGTAAAE
jgi:serine/threonine-protein kinase